VQLDEQLRELGGPGLSSQLGHPGELPEVVGVAQAMTGLLVSPIGGEPVVDCDPREAGQDLGGVHRGLAPFGV